RIRDAHLEVASHFRRAAKHARKAGGLLLKAKAQVAHGGWLPWLKDNCQLADRTSQLYMQIARHWRTLRAHPQFDADIPLSHLPALLEHRQGDQETNAGAKHPLAQKTTRPDKSNTKTPLGVCQFIHDLIAPFYKITTILDP